MRKSFGVLLVLLIASTSVADPLTQASRFLDQNRIADDVIAKPAGFDAIRAAIASTRDPETKFHPFVFALAGRHRERLEPEQRDKLQALVAARQNAQVNWHDVRNIVRIHAQILIWRHAAAADKKTVAEFLEQWERWTDLRLAYSFQEFAETDRFQRGAWEIFTTDQREKIVSGERDHLINKNLGHGRLYSADKQVRRELGTPLDQKAFDIAVAKTSESWTPMLAVYSDAAKFQRQREFALDQHDSSFALAAWSNYAAAFRDFAEAEFNAIREVVQAGYASDPKLDEKIDQHATQLYVEMQDKYGDNGKAFLRWLAVSQ